jgi:hypothetical protein
MTVLASYAQDKQFLNFIEAANLNLSIDKVISWSEVFPGRWEAKVDCANLDQNVRSIFLFVWDGSRFYLSCLNSD